MKIVCLVLPLLGCIDTSVTPLASLANRRLHIGGGPNAGGMVAELSWDEVPGEDCPVLSRSFRARANDMMLEVVMNDYVTEELWCVHSPLQLETFLPAPTEHTVLVLEDDSLAITADLGDLAILRTGTLTPDGPLAIGSEVSVAWTPESDLSRYTPRVLINQASGYTLPHTVDGSNVRFTIPDDGRYKPGNAVFLVSMNDGSSLPCTNAQCTHATAPGVFHSITLE